MDKPATGFLRDFTWKRFFLWSIYWFVITWVVAVIIDYFDPGAVVSENFTSIQLIKRFIGSFVAGFFFAVWVESKPKGKTGSDL
jgi:hypothetical protein